MNHPKKGAMIKVEPIKALKDIKLIKKLLADRPRDLALFVVGINTNLRASDLLGLMVSQVSAGEESVRIREQKTGKERHVVLNGAARKAIAEYLKVRGTLTGYAVSLWENSNWRKVWAAEPLFIGQRGPITVSTLSRMVKSWCAAINLKGNYASHTLRKTWGYHQRVTFGVDLPRLTLCFNHSSQRQTLDYLCIQPEEIQEVFDNEL